MSRLTNLIIKRLNIGKWTSTQKVGNGEVERDRWERSRNYFYSRKFQISKSNHQLFESWEENFRGKFSKYFLSETIGLWEAENSWSIKCWWNTKFEKVNNRDSNGER